MIGFVKPMIREAKGREKSFSISRLRVRLRSRFPCLIIRVKVVLDLGFVGPYVLMINQRVRSWPGGTRVTSSNVTYRTMKSLRGQMLGYGVGRSSFTRC